MSYTRGQWKAVKNSSWGETHKSQFNDREGYVICVEKRSELTAVVSVIGMPFVEQAEIDANAKLVSAAPDLLEALKRLNHTSLAIADNASSEYKNKYNEQFAHFHNAHLHAIEAIKKATGEV